MKALDAERFTKIRSFIDEYYLDHHKSPTVRDIAAGTGISKTAVQRYLTDMKAHGEIEYNGRRSIETDLSRVMTDITPAARYDSTVSCGLPTEVNVEPAEVSNLSFMSPIMQLLFKEIKSRERDFIAVLSDTIFQYS